MTLSMRSSNSGNHLMHIESMTKHTLPAAAWVVSLPINVHGLAGRYAWRRCVTSSTTQLQSWKSTSVPMITITKRQVLYSWRVALAA